MLFSLINNLEKLKLILASGSPRRYELLKTLGLEFEVVVSQVDETCDPLLSPEEQVLETASRKGRAVSEKHPDCLVISADTIVVTDKKVLGKPENETDAYNMLSLLNGRTHKVYTGFGLSYQHYDAAEYDVASTTVTFRQLTDEEIWAYINTGEPFDKAGSYAVQGQGSLLIEKIDGCYFNVVGFPLARFYILLDKFLSKFAL